MDRMERVVWFELGKRRKDRYPLENESATKKGATLYNMVRRKVLPSEPGVIALNLSPETSMSRATIRYRCNTCGHIVPRTELRRGAWGDPCCPACGANDVERHRTRFDQWYATFFLYKVY